MYKTIGDKQLIQICKKRVSFIPSNMYRKSASHWANKYDNARTTKHRRCQLTETYIVSRNNYYDIIESQCSIYTKYLSK